MNGAPTLLVYADKLFSPSESFIPRAYAGFGHLKPVFIGHELRGPVPAGLQALLLGPLHGPLGAAGFKQAGLVSARLKDTLRALNPVAIHAHFGKSGAYALPLARTLGLPLAVTYHGGDATKRANTASNPLRVYNRRRARLWREAALILPVSHFIAGELTAQGCPQARMVVHYNGADPERFRPGDKRNILLFAGRWTAKKGIDTLIDALAGLGPALSGWRVRLLGDGEMKAGLLARLEAAGVSAEWPGWVPADAMPAHFAEAAIVCVPSRRAPSGDAEGLPMVCLEAMLSGCAIAATRHAGIPEAVTEGVTGRLVAEGDAAGLAQALRDMLADPSGVRAMGEAGRARALADFNLGLQSRRLEERLSELAVRAGTLPTGPWAASAEAGSALAR